MSNLLINPADIQFEDLRNVAGYVAMSALPIAAGVFCRDVVSRPETSVRGIGGGDDVALGVGAEERKGRFGSTLRRHASVLLGSAGVAVAGITLLGPVTEYEVQTPGSDAVLVVDYSSSMQLTEDMEGGISRSTTVENALSDVSSRIDDMHVIVYGANSATLPAETELSELSDAVASAEIDPNGLALETALSDAQNIIEGAGEGTRNVVVVSDGIIEDKLAVRNTLTEMTEQGISVSAIVPGTEDGTYVTSEYQQVPFPSGATIEPFENLIGVEVNQTTQASAITVAVENGINKDATTTETRPVRTFLYTGLSFIFGGLLVAMRDKRQKRF